MISRLMFISMHHWNVQQCGPCQVNDIVSGSIEHGQTLHLTAESDWMSGVISCEGLSDSRLSREIASVSFDATGDVSLMDPMSKENNCLSPTSRHISLSSQCFSSDSVSSRRSLMRRRRRRRRRRAENFALLLLSSVSVHLKNAVHSQGQQTGVFFFP